MDVFGKVCIKVSHFEDVHLGDVFCLYSEINRTGAENVYMRCGDTYNDTTGVNLASGAICNFDNETPVYKINGYFQIKKDG